jgi:benzoate-CoA ligase
VLSYAALHDLVNRTGNALRALGVGAGDRALLLCLDAPEFLGAFWGAIKAGAVPVPVNTFLRADDWRHCLVDSAAPVAVVSGELLEAAAPALASSPALRHVLVARGPRGAHASYEDAVARASPALETAPTEADDAAFWLYSSGSTGAPKAAVHRQRDMRACAETFARQVLGIRSTDTVFSAAKLFFAYGLGNAGYFPASVGAQCVLDPRRMTPPLAFEVLAAQRPTLFFAGPALYAGMLALGDVPRDALGSVRLCVSAGEALPADIFRRWRDRFGVEILDGIGTTEILHMFMSNRAGAVRPGSSGTPVPGYEADIVDEEGRPVARGEIGNLRVKGESVMSGYWNQPEKTSAVLRGGGWIETGDKYYQDEDGYFWYCGRSDDMLKVSGAWVSPAEVEAALVQHPAVLQAAVVGHKDDEGLVKPKAFVVLKDEGAASEALADELKRFVKEKLPRYKYPRWVEFRAELPMTATGKIQRFKLRS